MPDSVIHLTIPPQTRPSAPVAQEISVLQGRLTGGSVLFPTGCLGLVGVRVFDRGVQVFPFPNGWMTGNGNPPTEFSVGRTMEGGNYLVRVEGYNLAYDWPHTPIVKLKFI